MSILERMLGPFWGPRGLGLDILGPTYSGKKVTVDRAMALVPVFSAVSQISGAIGTMPLPVYKRSEADDLYRKKATGSAAWRLLHDEPNPEMAPDQLWEIVASHIELWGNAFLYKRTLGDGTVYQLWPISPDRVMVDRDEKARKRFWIEGESFGSDVIMHIMGLSLDGVVGYSPVQMCRNALANSIAQEEFQGHFLRGDGKPSVLLRHPNEMKPDAKERLKESFDNAKTGGSVVLEEGIEVERWTMPLEDAQFIEQMEFGDKRVAQIFNLPPGRLGAKSGDSLKYSTTETQNLEFVSYTLQRRVKRIEGVLNRERGIFPDRNEYCEFLVDALLRADIKTRYASYALGVKGGWLDPDQDVRPRENLPRRTSAPPKPEGEP